MTYLGDITLSGVEDAASLTVVFEDSDRTYLFIYLFIIFPQ